jgi:hypothetical protein
VIWLQSFGGLLLLGASFLVIRAVIVADEAHAAPIARRRGKTVDLRRAA